MDYPITDVLQMMGRAGRPQYDRHGVAVIMVGDLQWLLARGWACQPAAGAGCRPGAAAPFPPVPCRS